VGIRNQSHFPQAIKIAELMQNITIFDSLFQVFEVKFISYFYDKLHNSVKLSHHFPEVSDFIIHNLVKSDDHHHATSILTFLERTNLLSIPAVFSEISNDIMSHIHHTSTSPHNHKERINFQRAFAELEKFIVHLPSILQSSISNLFTATIIKNDEEAFMNEIFPIALANANSLTAFFGGFFNITNVAEKFGLYLESQMEKNFDA
jgi:hypothetical protein